MYLIVGVCIIVLISAFFRSFMIYKLMPYLLGIMFVGIGIIFHFLNTVSFENHSISKNETIVFTISKKLNSNDQFKKYEIVAETGSANFKAIFYVPKEKKELDFNHIYKANVYVTSLNPPQYDFQFDYSQYLKRKGIDYQCYFSGNLLESTKESFYLNEKIRQKRWELLQTMDKLKMSSQSREFLKGIILADRTEMDYQTMEDFNKTGLIHLLAISGTHIAVIFGLFYFISTQYSPVRFKKYGVIGSVILIWIFAAFIGFGNSVLRSCIMLTVYFIYVLLERKPDVLHSMALASFIILISDTQQIFDVGFQLSFLAVLGIYWLNQPILKCFPRQDNYLKKIVFNTFSISVSAQLTTLPLVLYYFHQFSFISIIANFIIVPFSEFIIVFSFLMTTLVAINLDFVFITRIYDFVIHFLLETIHWFAGFDMFLFKNVSVNISEMFLLLGIVYLLRFVILKINIRNTARLVMAMLSFCIMRIGFNIYQYQLDEVLIHDFYKNKIFSVKKGNKACFWIEDGINIKKVDTYIISQYRCSRRLDDVQVKTFPASVKKVVYDEKEYHLK
ncbi:ComEC/Rec2 family competence protein [Chryseobacterium nematophagum]|nr:ComEC/Rec2 family competence protein [Chryseobacterium nematophagum]